LAITGCISGQDNENEELMKTFDYLNRAWSNDLRLEFKNLVEEDVGLERYYELLNSHRYDWLYGKKNQPLREYFSSQGIDSDHNISLIVLLSYHRNLNSRKMEVDSQIKIYANREKTMSICEKKRLNKAKEYYAKYFIGDSVIVKVPLQMDENEDIFIVSHDCPNAEWVFDPNIDLTVRGIMIDKDIFFREPDTYIEVRVDSILNPSKKIVEKIGPFNENLLVTGHGDDNPIGLKLGDTLHISLKSCMLEKT